MNSSSEIVGVSSSLQLETVLDDSISEGDWEIGSGFIFLSKNNFLKMILDESMRAKGKDFAGKQRGMNLEICHFKTFFKMKWQISRFFSYAKLSVSSRHKRVLGQFQINKKIRPQPTH